MGPPSRNTVRWYAPIVASCAVVITLVTCVIITKAKDIYTGGLKWPYFSDMGRDAPGYYVFCVGLTVCAIALAFTWYFYYQFQSAILRKPIEIGQLGRSVLISARIMAFLGMISVIGLPVLAFFSTSSYSSLHNNGAYFFFFLETIAITINTIISYKILKREKMACAATVLVDNDPAMLNSGPNDNGMRLASVRRTFTIQAIFYSLFLIGFLLYMPIGLAVVATTPRLTIQECLDRNLGEEYCTEMMKYKDNLTKLWNYEEDFSASQMRAAGQLVCILTLIGYSVSFLSHDYARVVDGDDQPVHAATNDAYQA